MIVHFMKRKSLTDGITRIFLGLLGFCAFSYGLLKVIESSSPTISVIFTKDLSVILVAFLMLALFVVLIGSSLWVFFYGIALLSSYKYFYAYRAIKRYEDPELVIQRIENNIKNKKFSHLYINEKKAAFFYLDENEALSISLSGQDSGYLHLKDVVWSYYDDNSYKGQALLYVWGKTRLTSLKSLMPKDEVIYSIDILEKHSNGLFQYIDRLRMLRDFNYGWFVKKCMRISKLRNK